MRIRSLFISAGACSLMASVSSAQTAMARPSFGILLGTNIATVSDADKGFDNTNGVPVNKKQRIGLNVGVFARIPLAGMVSLQPEVHYAQNGVTLEATGGEVGKLDLHIDYVEVPVLLRLDIPTGSSIHPILLAGASAAYRVKCQLSGGASGATASFDCESNPGSSSTSVDPFKKSDFSVVGGAGLALTSMGRSISLQARYTLGLQTIATDTADGIKPKNRALSILLGIGF
ncbi:MAG: PorT family protein [Gemmatimonadota bacterium]|nr:PorT family protein [Gemmatimonadota bacterium]